MGEVEPLQALQLRLTVEPVQGSAVCSCSAWTMSHRADKVVPYPAEAVLGILCCHRLCELRRPAQPEVSSKLWVEHEVRCELGFEE